MCCCSHTSFPGAVRWLFSWFAPGLIGAIPVSFNFPLVECEYSCVYPYFLLNVLLDQRMDCP